MGYDPALSPIPCYPGCPADVDDAAGLQVSCTVAAPGGTAVFATCTPC